MLSWLEWPVAQLMSLSMALVGQDNIMLPVSVSENIAYGGPEASADELREAARRAGAAAFID